MANKDFWGQSLHINLHGCDVKKMSKHSLQVFCRKLCRHIKMKPYGKAMVRRFGEGNLRGNSALQFIQTSSISIHADEYYERVFIDIFSCKRFDRYAAKAYCMEYFGAKKGQTTGLDRG